MNDEKKITIDTRDFGEMEIGESEIINFPNGIFAFEDVKNYSILKPMGDGSAPMWLQNIENKYPCFIVFKIDEIINNYMAVPAKEDFEVIDYEKDDEIVYYSIAVIPEDCKKTTVNLKSPVVINKTKKLGAQIILSQNYEIKYRIYTKKED